jgi:quercetin dioxygenase-like cupin family protein
MHRTSLLIAVLALLAATAFAQDPVKVDPQHYKVESENAQVRVLRIHYGPHEKSPMHYHPNAVAVFLTDGHVKFGLPGGKTQDATFKAGETQWNAAGRHAPENVGEQPFELILVELKGKSAAAAKRKAE